MASQEKLNGIVVMQVNDAADRLIELVSANKLNTTNAWDHDSESCLADLLNSVTDSIGFARAGCVVGATADAYGRKVDSLFTRVDQVAHSGGQPQKAAGVALLRRLQAMAVLAWMTLHAL